ncbi:MAG: AMP-binding protein [Erysipelotrichaceae bacterium]|nr:AMP-binding protein [Erysipelotrichaceae bacterium]
MSIYTHFCKEIFDEKGQLVDLTIDYPDNFNFGYDAVDYIADKDPDKRALVWCNTQGKEKIFSFSDLQTYSNQVANVFLSRGIRKGDHVMLVLKRHYEYWLAAIALHKIGAVMIPATHMLTVDDFVYRILSANIKGIVCTTESNVPQKILDAVKQSQQNLKLWSVQNNICGFENLSVMMKYSNTNLNRIETQATDPMMLYFTSGTTGKPKGVIHDYRYPLAHIVTAKYWHQAIDGGLHFTVAETGWAKASWGKLYGQWLVGSAVMVYDFDNFEPKQLVSIINRYGVTSFCAPPTVYRYLVRKGIPEMPSLRHVTTAGETLAPTVFRKFKEQTGLTLFEGYGQTETTLLIANFKGSEPIEGSMGTPSPFYKVDLVDKKGNSVGANEIGEVIVRSTSKSDSIGIFCSYLDDERQYNYVWRNGIYHTGDAAYRDEEGNYWFHGRFDDIIKTGGFRVGPNEVESVIMEHHAVVECSVIGVPDALRGQSIKAYIVLKNDYIPTTELANKIRTFCNQKLSEYKWIRSIEFVNEMPKTISGKIRKTILRRNSR